MKTVDEECPMIFNRFATPENERNQGVVLKVLQEQRSDISGAYPLIYHLDITGRCNLSCLYCARDFYVKTKHPFLTADMSDEVFERLLPFFKHAKLVALLSMLGEPLLHKSLPRWWRQIAEAGAKPQTTTNGTFLTPELTDLFTGSGGRLKMSIDSFDQKELNVLRPLVNRKQGMTSEVLREKLSLIDKYRRVHENSKFQFGANICVTSLNLGSVLHTIEECLRHARVDIFSFNPFILPSDEHGNYHTDAASLSMNFDDERVKQCWRDIVVRCAELSKSEGIRFGLPYSREQWKRILGDEAYTLAADFYEEQEGTGDEGLDKSGYHCCVPWLKAYVRSDGTVLKCYIMHMGGERDLVLGNVSETPFDEIWHSESAVKFRAQMAGRENSFCNKCAAFWRFYTKQRVL
jgi:MoaA/NifB/PqqE/SkfB family radical SAM enzyme